MSVAAGLVPSPMVPVAEPPATPSARPGRTVVGNAPIAAAKGTCDGAACARVRAETAEPLLPEAQRRWAARPLVERLQPVRLARHWIAANLEGFTKAISPQLARAEADTLVAELLPLLDAMRFLERNAGRLLAPRKLGGKHRPLWLSGVQAEIHREPLGHVLVIGPANFPLYLPGVQTLQALVAGNAVTWKPGSGGGEVAVRFASALREAGLPRGILRVTDDSVEAAQDALSPTGSAEQVHKVVFTGSYATGRHILRTLAETATPAVMELSGADAVVVLPSADLRLTAKAVAFGLRLNGAAVCMSPRRVIATRETLRALTPVLVAELAKVPASPVAPDTARKVQTLLIDALAQGAELVDLHATDALSGQEFGRRADLGEPALTSAPTQASGHPLEPILLKHATPEMAITRADLFAPVLSLVEAQSVLHIPDLVNDNPYGLTAAVFGAPAEAGTLAGQLRVGTVVINDLIAPTVDPRIPFGGRGRSGFGLTRGGEGLLEMTAVKTVLRRRKGLTRHYEPLAASDTPLFTGLIGALHAGTLRDRLRSVRSLIGLGYGARKASKAPLDAQRRP